MILPLVLLVTLVSTSCATERSSVRKEERLQETLNELVEGYWHALRWEYYDMAVPYVEKEEDQGKLWEYFLARQGKVTIGQVNIYHIEFDDDLEHAIVSVQYELLRTNEAVLHKVTARQRWYLAKNGHWYLKLDPEELTRLD